MDITEKKVIIIIAPENFRDEEYFHTRESLERAGLDVYTASLQKKAVSSVDKKEVEVDMLLKDVGDEYDAIVFVGGSGAKIYFENEIAKELVQKYNNDSKIVAAICIAPLILAHAGIMNDKKATSWHRHQNELKEFGVLVTGEDVTVDGNIITGNGPKAAYRFGDTIAKALA